MIIGVRGFEPPASPSRTVRSSQAELHPDSFEILFRFCRSTALHHTLLKSRYKLGLTENIHSDSKKYEALYSKAKIIFKGSPIFEKAAP